jgi:PHD/YefM family antitoxin component YafN of YafNO toxin-antitoxin module
MPKIMPVSDLRNYNEVLHNCDADKQVFLTRNGRGRYVILDIEFYEKQQAMLQLISALAEGETSVKSHIDWISIEDAMQRLGAK